MNDTSAEVQTEYRKRLRATNASQRLRMMSGMFSAAKVLARPAAGSAKEDADPPEAVLFERMYRTDFSVSELAAISEHLRAIHAP